MGIFELANKMRSVQLSLMIEDAIEDNSKDAVRRNQDQMRDGENALGSEISPGYKSPVYAVRKNKQNSRPGLGTPDLFVTGKLYSEMDLVIQTPNVFLTSFDEKMKFPSIQQYKNVFGLQKQNQFENRQLNNHSLIRLFKQKAGL